MAQHDTSCVSEVSQKSEIQAMHTYLGLKINVSLVREQTLVKANGRIFILTLNW